MAMAMMNPATQLKLSKIFGWVDTLIEAGPASRLARWKVRRTFRRSC